MRRTVLALAAGLTVAVLPGVAHAGNPAAAPAERFLLVLAGPPGQPGTVVASGAVADVGTITPADGDVGTFVFPDGTLRLTTTSATRVDLPRPPLCLQRL